MRPLMLAILVVLLAGCDERPTRPQRATQEDALPEWASQMAATPTEFVPQSEYTAEQAAAARACWQRALNDCVADCGGSMLNASPSRCRFDREGRLHEDGWGCQMPEDYDACVQTYRLREEVQALRDELRQARGELLP